MPTTPSRPNPAPADHEGDGVARALVAQLAASAVAQSPRIVEGPLVALAPWLSHLPPAVRRGVVDEISRALSFADAAEQDHRIVAALTAARQQAARFAE